MSNNEYDPQEKRLLSESEYGIKKYTPDQTALHRDIMKLLVAKKYENISADDCMIVFARVYSTYVVSQLQKEEKICDVKTNTEEEQSEFCHILDQWYVDCKGQFKGPHPLGMRKEDLKGLVCQWIESKKFVKEEKWKREDTL